MSEDNLQISSTFAPVELLSLYSSTVALIVAAHCQHAARLLNSFTTESKLQQLTQSTERV